MIRKKYDLKITTTQRILNEEPEQFELLTEAEFARLKDGSFAITYDDSVATGLKGKSTITCTGCERATVTREGDAPSELILEAGKTHHCQYATPYGSVIISVTTSLIDNMLAEDGGSLRFKYAIDANAGGLMETEVHAELY